MRLPKLTPRLRLAARMARGGGVVADIGTDHAYLPVYLVNAGLCEKAYACDINPGPLARAEKTVEAFDAGGRIRLVLCNGLDGVKFADEVVIAGMGGELIAAILSRCAFVKDAGVHLVLQPMTAQPELRGWLCREGFEIEEEAVAREGSKLYVVMLAAFTGEKAEPDDYFRLTGLLPGNRDSLSAAYLRHIAAGFTKKAQGLLRSAGGGERAAAAFAMAEKLENAAQKCAEDKENDKSR